MISLLSCIIINVINCLGNISGAVPSEKLATDLNYDRINKNQAIDYIGDFSDGPFLFFDDEYDADVEGQLIKYGMIPFVTMDGSLDVKEKEYSHNHNFESESNRKKMTTSSIGQCVLGVYWILAKGVGENCDTACSKESPASSCAGDSPTYDGWPYNLDAGISILHTLDSNRFPNAGERFDDVA